MMKPLWRNILIGFFSVAVLTYAGLSLYSFHHADDSKTCRKLIVSLPDSSKIQLITIKDVLRILDDNGIDIKGNTLRNINTDEIERILLKNKMIQAVECYKTPSGVVDIKVRQRVPKFRVVGFGSYYVDENRKPLPVSANFAAYIPVVSGRVTASMACSQIFDFICFLEKNSFWNNQIEQINIREDKKVELVPRVGDYIIELGPLDNYEQKLGKLMKLYQRGFNLMGWNRYKTINLEYKNQVVCAKGMPDPPRLEQHKDSSLNHVNSVDKDSIIASKI